MRRARAAVEIGDVLELDTRPSDRGKSRAECIVGAALESQAGWHILFVHADADGDDARARAERVAPAIERLREQLATSHACVAVVPIQMTDAWLLADFAVFQRVLGTTLDSSALGVPTRGQAIERLADPKQTLTDAWRVVHEHPRRAYRLTSIYQPIGEQVRLDELRKLSGYLAFESELEQALRTLAYLR
ncbi:hypothetical protein ACNOYE_01870 [Nannocystaceae bacterium ST9]